MEKKGILGILFILSCILFLQIVFADPTGPTSIQAGQSQRGAINPAQQVNAMAGNITELIMNATSITKAWQGYFGNISGTITLDNANNWTLYDWRMTTPSGKVFATRNDTVILWSSIACANTANITAEDTYMGNAGAQDTINFTFNYTSSAYYVGNVQVTNCPSTYTYVNDTKQSSLFQELLLMDPSKNALVYTSIIESRQIGFDNRSHDFQMLVAEKGRSGDNTATPYYFYVELN
jgi:hypothetical protein